MRNNYELTRMNVALTIKNQLWKVLEGDGKKEHSVNLLGTQILSFPRLMPILFSHVLPQDILKLPVYPILFLNASAYSFFPLRILCLSSFLP